MVTHALHLRLAQFLEWELSSLSFLAPRALVERLVAGSIDPETAEPLVDPDLTAEVVAALADAAGAGDPQLAAVCNARVHLWLTAGDGGDRPEQLVWVLPPSSAARLYALFDDTHLRTRLFAVAEARRAARAAVVESRHAALAAVLEQHHGVPRRHKRVHWAFVNLAAAGQTTDELRGPGGVLPHDATSLDPASLRSRYATTPRLPLRFVLTDRFELNVLDDARYWDTIARWGFPPNHETLAGTRPILASGYLTVERGAITAIEDDGVMIPGKLGAGLPPIQEVLEALGYAVDLDRVAGASLVVDWEAFADAAGEAEAPELAELDPERAGELLASRSHAERPALVVGWIRRAAARGDRDATVRATAALLDGFRLINVGGRALAAGDLPKGAEWIDEALAGYLVRKVIGR